MKSWLTKTKLTAVIALVVVGGFMYQRISYLSAAPGEDKECEPLFAEYANEKRTVEWMETPDISWTQAGGMVNDASCVDETAVYGVVDITTEEDIVRALNFAKTEGLKVSLAGAKHSMGGQAFSPGNVVLDMTGFNDISFDEEASTVTVQSGATWHDIQNVIHPTHAIMAMQSTDIFTVGGSISVNAHGMDHQAGAVENSIVSMRVLLPDGSVQSISRTESPELYHYIVGGYGLFGIIIDATLQVVPNDVYESSRQLVDYQEFPQLYDEMIEPNTEIGLMYTHLSTAPGSSFLREALVYQYEKIPETVDPADLPALPEEVSAVGLRRFLMNLSKTGPLWQNVRWWSEKHLESQFESCTVSRSAAQRTGEACLVARNEPMHDSVPYLQNSLRGETDILHEYFIPRDQLVSFIDGMRTIMEEQETNLLNASVRVVNAEEGALTYAPEPAYSVVLYINQQTDAAGHEKMRRLTSALIDLTNEHRGRFFLPYQLHYTREQLQASYPNIADFFAAKRQYDPEEILSNTWYERYSTS